MITQDNRFITIDTPLGEDALLLVGFKGAEGISSLFDFELSLLSRHNDIPFRDIIGRNVTVSIMLADGETRFLNGLISRFSQGSGLGPRAEAHHFSLYTATMVPWFWLFTKTVGSRIFQELSVPEIIAKIFKEKHISDYASRLHNPHEKREYCVQYRESDFNFISRLLEEEGIFYFFEHENGKHTLVFADAPEEHQPCPNQETVHYHTTGGGLLAEDVITGIEWRQEIRSGAYTVNDYNFEAPTTDLKTSTATRQNLGPGRREIYDHPGRYQKRGDGDRLATLRMEEEEAQITVCNGGSDCRSFTSGYRFRLQDYFRDDLNNREYVLTEVRHEASLGTAFFSSGTDADHGPVYTNSFSCIPFDVPYRPPRKTPRPLVHGAQTAIVVGPSGDEIYTDKYGRVKVQFHWDREGQRDENSSCWIRVSHAWAGPGWGSIHLPRIGNEVVVEFLDGDPDRPIVTGRVYHGANPPPYKLPDEKTRSVIRSNTSPGGGGFNEISFEDKKDAEILFIKAEKDQDIRVKNDCTEVIGNDRRLQVKNDQREHVENNRQEKVDGEHREEIGKDRNLIVKGKEAKKVGDSFSLLVKSDVTEIIQGKHVQKTKTYSLKAQNVVIEAMRSISLTVGPSHISIENGGIEIKTAGTLTVEGTTVSINGTASTEVKSSGITTVKGSMTQIN